MATLEIRALRKRFGSLEILKGIDISLEQGGFLVLVGPSGCGKSTLLNTIAGLESISSGEIMIGGQVVNDLHPSKRDIAMGAKNSSAKRMQSAALIRIRILAKRENPSATNAL